MRDLLTLEASVTIKLGQLEHGVGTANLPQKD